MGENEVIVKLNKAEVLISLDNILRVTKFADDRVATLTIKYINEQETIIKYRQQSSAYGNRYEQECDADFKQIEDSLVSKYFNSEDVKDLISRASDITYSDLNQINRDFHTCLMNFKSKYYGQ